jgi:hypothetical protein
MFFKIHPKLRFPIRTKGIEIRHENIVRTSQLSVDWDRITVYYVVFKAAASQTLWLRKILKSKNKITLTVKVGKNKALHEFHL